MSVSPAGRTLGGDLSSAAVQARPWHVDADLYLVTMDGQGRMTMQGAARRMGWRPGRRLALTVDDGVLRLTAPASRATVGIEVSLDRRYRVLLPYGLRVTTGFWPGVRLLLAVLPVEGVVAAVPVARVVATFGGGP